MTEVLPDAFGAPDRTGGGRLRMAERLRRGRRHRHQAGPRRLADEQIDWVVDAYTRGAVADEQMSALAMAMLLNGMAAARSPVDRRR